MLFVEVDKSRLWAGLRTMGIDRGSDSGEDGEQDSD